MVLNEIHGSYSPGLNVIVGGFQLNGSSAPTVLRDGTNVASAKKMFTVTRVSAGLYEVDFTTGYPLPQLPFILPMLEQAAPATTLCKIHYVVGSWNPTSGNRKFRLQIETIGSSPAASDADASNRVTFVILGAHIAPGVDPA